ncbi:oxidoreductase [Sphingomonas sp. UYP23]
MNIDGSAVFTPIVINGHTIKNRLAVTPMTRIAAAQDGRPADRMTTYSERFARGGFGTVTDRRRQGNRAGDVKPQPETRLQRRDPFRHIGLANLHIALRLRRIWS